MAESETSGILDEIQYLVSDQLQVVSYKWLSRNFSVSSDDAKRLLQDFVKRCETGTEVLYTLAGWKKNDPSLYQVRLTSKHALEEAKQEFDETCSVEIYSVQACLPKDPADLGNGEFHQAGELFKQSRSDDNCLLDNRFCRVSNSSVKRTRVTQTNTSVPQVKSVGALGSSAKISASKSPIPAQPGLKSLQESSKLQSPDGVKDVNNKSFIRACEQNRKLAQDEGKGKVSELPVNAKKVAVSKPSGNGGSLANMWGRASSKVKTAETNCAPNSSASADAQICVREEEHVSSDDEFQRVSTKCQSSRGSGRKRKVVMDYSDEEDAFEDAVHLASPDPPKKSLTVASRQNSSDLKNNKLNFEEEKEKPSVKDGNKVDRDGDLIMTENSESASKDGSTKAFSLEMKALSVDKGVKNAPVGTTVQTEKPKSPQRKKVLKTRIDERGREVTEVVWEGKEETKPDTSTAKKVETIAPSNADGRPPANKKSPAVGNITAQGGKAGNKKTQAKDPKQGNIMSFFKKKT